MAQAVAPTDRPMAWHDATDGQRTCVDRTPLERLRLPLPVALLGTAADARRLERVLSSSASRKRRKLEAPRAALDRACVPWTGAAQFSYAGRVWSPPLLLYTLCIADVDTRRARVARTCTTDACVEPTHLRLEAREARLEATSAYAYALERSEHERMLRERRALADERAHEIQRETLASLRALLASEDELAAAAAAATTTAAAAATRS